MTFVCPPEPNLSGNFLFAIASELSYNNKRVINEGPTISREDVRTFLRLLVFLEGGTK